MTKNPNPPIVLASASPRRIELMQNLGLRFEIIPADIDEVTEHAQIPAEIVAELAYLKAKRVQEILQEKKSKLRLQPHVILAADTIVVLDGEVLGKPDNKEHAVEMLTRLSGTCHEVFTGVHVIHQSEGSTEAYHDVGMSKVFFRQLQKSEIESYVATKEPMDKAGAYALQGIGAFLVEKIEGCPSNIIGLPVPKTVALLRRCGLKVMGY
ncbi:MAG: septum formation inhibitor Maf [Cyanobacteria bacterium SZAS LIN-3]|nr:septum formation inhibitor Maf [Cyanobacteria bacterium SZAS LIN-3]